MNGRKSLESIKASMKNSKINMKERLKKLRTKLLSSIKNMSLSFHQRNVKLSLKKKIVKRSESILLILRSIKR